jgi:hypothetical protein
MTESGRRGSRHTFDEEQRLAELGYRQDLKREWSMLHNFGISFSIISVVTGRERVGTVCSVGAYEWAGVTTLFQYGLLTGGPAVMSIGWIVGESAQSIWRNGDQCHSWDR